MRKIIPNPTDPGPCGYVVESPGASDAVKLEADGVLHWFAPGDARRIAHALLRAAARVEPPIRAADGGGSAPDDLPEVAGSCPTAGHPVDSRGSSSEQAGRSCPGRPGRVG